MLKRALFSLLFLLALGVFAPLFSADYVPGEILVKIKPAATLIKAEQKIFAPLVKTLVPPQQLKTEPLFSQTYKISVPLETDLFSAIEELQKNPNVLYAEPNYLVYACLTPNDTYFSQQWGLSKIEAPTAWETTTGSAEEIIAVVDTGVNYNHEDLTGKVILGHDYVHGDDDPMDDQGHGTHVAGIAAATTNNSKGVAGTDWKALILAIKVLNDDSPASGSAADVAAGIREAADAGADVINLSLGGSTSSSVIQEACTYAYNKGSVVVAAAGNDGAEKNYYPAAYTNVIGVAATDENDKKSSFSNYGSWVDVSAPGSNIQSTYYPGNTTYQNQSGTSMSVPFVCGLAALIKNRHPSWGPAQVAAEIGSTATSIDSENPSYVGKLGTGRINMARALGGFLAYISSPATGSSISGTVPILGYATGEGFTSYKLEYRSASAATTDAWTQIGSSHTTPVTNGLLETWTTVPNANGAYTLKLTVNTTAELTHSVSVTLSNTPAIIGTSLGGPNPFSPRSGGEYTIYYNLTSNATISIYVFDLTGNLVWKKTESQSAGPNYVKWNGKDPLGDGIANGVYFYRIIYESGGTQSLLGKGKILILN